MKWQCERTCMTQHVNEQSYDGIKASNKQQKRIPRSSGTGKQAARHKCTMAQYPIIPWKQKQPGTQCNGKQNHERMHLRTESIPCGFATVVSGSGGACQKATPVLNRFEGLNFSSATSRSAIDWASNRA